MDVAWGLPASWSSSHPGLDPEFARIMTSSGVCPHHDIVWSLSASWTSSGVCPHHGRRLEFVRIMDVVPRLVRGIKRYSKH